MSKKRKRWSFSAGRNPHTVRVFERDPGGVLYARVWDRSRRGGKGDWLKKSLGHRERERAKAYALEEAAKFVKGIEELRSGNFTLGRIFASYRAHKTPDKAPSTQVDDDRKIELWTRWLGADMDPARLTLQQWEGFKKARGTGAIDARGKPVPKENRRSVRARAVQADLVWLRWVFSWARSWTTPQGHSLLAENPLEKKKTFTAQGEKNPKRPVATTDRYEALRAVTDQVEMEVRWNRKRKSQRSYLSEVLDLVVATGRRITPVCRLQMCDLILDRTALHPKGAIRWPGKTDKEGREWKTPLNPLGRAAIDRILSERPGLGATPLFPSPVDPSKPIRYELASKWLREAERLAGLEKQDGTLWHAYRRKWATERKVLPVQDVAKAGGWKTSAMVQDIYQQADDESTLSVVMHAAEVREIAQ